MSDRPAEVCPKCKGLLARDSRERWPDAPAILTFHCGTTVVEDSAPNQSDTCKLRCADQQIADLTAQLAAAQGKLAAIDLIVDDQRGVRSQGTRLNDIYTILHPTPPAQPAVTVQSAPIGTKAPSIGGGWWFRVEHGWKWNGPDGSGGTFPMPGGDWNGKLILPAPPAGEQFEATITPLAYERPVERGWLIERSISGSPKWLYANGELFCWTGNANQAIRFCRRADAEQVAAIIGDDAEKVTEHQWDSDISDAEVDANLKAAGIDMTEANERLRAMVAEAKHGQPTITPHAVETVERKRLGQLFENKFDCYADTGDEGDVVLAMTKDTFVKVVHAEIAALKAKVSELKAISTSK